MEWRHITYLAGLAFIKSNTMVNTPTLSTSRWVETQGGPKFPNCPVSKSSRLPEVLWVQQMKSAKTLFTFETNLACSTHLKYTKEIQKKQRKNLETTYFIFKPQKQFYQIFKIGDCVPEVLTLLLTPILTYICMANVRFHPCHLCHLGHKCNLCHKFDTNMYVNMGVKRSYLNICRATTIVLK